MNEHPNVDNDNLGLSQFSSDYDELSESKKDILNNKYNCSICLTIIKNENPLFCYICQKIFHHSCLKNWDTRLKQMHKTLSCPICRNQLPIQEWKEKRNHDEDRTEEAEILNKVHKFSSSNEYSQKSANLLRIILKRFNDMHSLIDHQKNNKLNELIEQFASNLFDPSIDDISIAILEELEFLEEYIEKKEIIKKNDIIYLNEINLKYVVEKEGIENIFGENFVINNLNKINLIINGKKSPLVKEYYLKKGENNVKICVKNTLTNLESMFMFCKTLKNIDELKYLNTKDVTNFSLMFENCELTDINPLENWDTSNGTNFSSMFSCCQSLTNIKALKNWDVSSGTNFSSMFYGCKSLWDLNSLQKWNVSKGINFNSMFFDCKSLYNLKPLKDWNVSNGANFGYMFGSCLLLSNLKPLENWNVSNGNIFYKMFSDLKLLKDIKPLQNWNVSKGEDFKDMFIGCELLNLNYLKK